MDWDTRQVVHPATDALAKAGRDHEKVSSDYDGGAIAIRYDECLGNKRFVVAINQAVSS
jgi:hypothetical protein